MADPAENIINDDGGAWKETLAGDNQEVLEQLGSYESPEQFLEEFNNLRNADWRDGIAGEDDKFKSQLERFKSPADFGNAFRESQQKIRSGQFKEPLSADASDEDIRAYRDQHGIPQEASGYTENLPDGLVLGDDDKEIFGQFAEALHKVNAPPEIAHAALEWYNSFAEQAQDELAQQDHTDHTEAEDFLRREWGGDYRTNVNIISAMVEKNFGEETKEAFLNARAPDGTAIMNIPGVMEGLASLARATMHPMSVPGQTSDPQQSVEDEIAEIEKVMREDRAAYNKDEGMQARLRELYDIRIKHAKA